MLIVPLLILFMLPLDAASNKKSRHKGALKGTQWWTLANAGERSNDLRTFTQLYNNPRLLPLTKRQRKVVTRNPGAIIAVARGAKMATEECQFQFRNRRWNCPTFWDDQGATVFGKILERGLFFPVEFLLPPDVSD
ncbi:hypothetical protein C0Q70_01587 [Pomacea canaliculata]|uniref:Protein Wnt n=1 Tax=Pomacea canaliculata TaxID=400727 RepID=A0A2T7PZW6_POMCA|nr:hypothetical protein C0Q70_01587 [Pomacea canaliculata]